MKGRPLPPITDAITDPITDPIGDAPAEARRFVAIDYDVIDHYNLSPQAGWLYARLVRHADYKTGYAWPDKGTLAEHLQLKQERSVDRYVRELLDAGLLTAVRRRYCHPDDTNDWVPDRPDEVRTRQTSNLYVVNLRPTFPQVKPGCAAAQGGGALQRTRTRTNELKPQDQKTSVRAAARDRREVFALDRKRKNGEETETPLPLHPKWTPNNANRSEAAQLGVTGAALDALAAKFRRGALEYGARRSNWGAAFTEFVRQQVAGDAVETFGDLGIEETLDDIAADLAVQAVVAQTAPVIAQPAVAQTAPVIAQTPAKPFNAPTPTGTPTEAPIEAQRPVQPETAAFDDAARAAEIAAMRRGRLEREVARALAGGIRHSERAEVLRRIDAGQRPETIIEALRAARLNAKRRAAAELAHHRPA